MTFSTFPAGVGRVALCRGGLALLALALCAATPLGAGEARNRECLGPTETAEAITEFKLVRPILAMRAARQQFGAEPLGVKLCRWGLDYVYEIALLEHEGRVVHAFVNATNGDLVGTRNAR